MILKDEINECKNMVELDKLRIPIMSDFDNFKENQKLFVKQKNKIKRNGGHIN